MTASTQFPSFWNVNYNFSNLYQAVHHNPKNGKADSDNKMTEMQLYQYLTPNLRLNGNCNINFVPNDVVRFCLFESGLQNELLKRIRQALDFTHDLFHAHRQKLMQKYIPLFHESLGTENLESGKLKKAQEKIQEFYEITQPFLREVLTRRNPRMAKIFERHFCPDCFSHMSELQNCQDIITLQGTLGVKELPLKLILNLAFGEKVDDVELNEFLSKLSSRQVNIRMLHRALKAIVECASLIMILPGKNPDLGVLERRLYEKKPELFTQHDPQHLEWRNSLKEGTELRTMHYLPGNRVEIFRIILGKQIAKKQAGIDNNIFFEIKECYRTERSATKGIDESEAFEKLTDEMKLDSSPQVLWISVNEAIPYIRHSVSIHQEETSGFKGLKPSSIQFIDPKGRFGFVEKLHVQPLGSAKGSSENRDAYLMYLIKWVKWLISEDTSKNKEPFTPVPLNFQYIMFNHLNRLTSVKLLSKEESFRFAPFEQFAFQAANGDQEIFKKFMADTGLYDLNDAKFIRTAAQYVFEPENFDLDREHRKGVFIDKAILHRAQKLQGELKQMREGCIKKLECPPHPKLNESQLKRLEKLILEHYHKSGAVTLLPVNMLDEVITAFQRMN